MSNISFDEIMNFYPRHNRSVYDDLINDCKSKNLIPFVGAGLSAFCGYKLWPDVLRQLSEFVFSEEKRNEINKMIDDGELLEAAQAISDNCPRMPIELKKIIDYKKIRFCDKQKLTHSAAYLMPLLFSGNMVITTNFDRVLEEVYSKHQVGFEKAINPYDTDILNQILQSNSHCLFKLHGDIGESTISADKLVFTKEQYENVYADDSPLVAELTDWFKSKRILFLGCSLTMDKTMEVLKKVFSQNSSLDHYAILACKPEDMQKRIKEMGDLGISAIFYPDGKHDAVRVILERILEELNYPVYEKLKKEEKALTSNPEQRFMYDSEFIAFTGRESEMEALEEFCEDNKPITWWAVTGPGGMGKSRLIHEFSKRKKKQNWQTIWLKQENYRNIINLIPGPNDTLVIADDAQAYLQDVGEWITSISERPRSGKLRIILLERDGNNLKSASWGDKLQEDSPYNNSITSNCYRPEFLKLTPLSEEELKTIMKNFATASGKPLKSDSHADTLLKTLKNVDNGFQRPIYALAITDAWCGGKDPTHWDKTQVLDALVNRELSFYFERLKNISDQRITKTIKSELETLLARSCLNNFISLDDINEDDYPKLKKYAEASYLTFIELIQQIGIVSKLKVHLVEIHESKKTVIETEKTVEAVVLKCPDLIKEYLVLRQAFDKIQQNLLFIPNWENDPQQLIFMTRLLRDYPEKLNETQQFWNMFFSRTPQLRLPAQIYSHFLFGIILLLPNISSKALETLKNIQTEFNSDEHIALLYAKSLFNLAIDASNEYKIIYVNSISILTKEFASNEEIATLLAKGLLLLSFDQNLEERTNYTKEIALLFLKFKKSEEIAKQYARSLVLLSGDQTSDERIASFKELEILYQQFENEQEITELYAIELSLISDNQNLKDCIYTVNKLKCLQQQSSESKKIAEIYASKIISLSFLQTTEDDVRNSLAEAQRILSEFPDNTDIMLSCAKTHFNLTLQQSGSTLQKTVVELREYLLEHMEINADFQEALDVYLSNHPDHTERYQPLRV